MKVLRTKEVPFVKVLWQYHDIKEATWETDERMREPFSELFANTGTDFVDKILFKEGRL